MMLYGFATLAISGKSQLSSYVVTVAYVQSIPASSSSLAWVAWLADTVDASTAYSSVACKLVASTVGTALSNSINASPLVVSVPYSPLSVSTIAALSADELSMVVELIIGSSSSLSCTLSLYQLGSTNVYGTSFLPLPYARNPSTYSLNVTLTSLPLAQHSDLYWQYSLSYPNGTTTPVTGSTFAVSTGSSDSLDISTLVASPNISIAVLQQAANSAWLVPINVTASTAASRWLYVRMMGNSTVLGIGSRLVLGATALSYHTVPVQLLQPVQLDTQLEVQVWLTPLSAAASSTLLAVDSATVWFVQPPSASLLTSTAAAVDALDTSEVAQQQYIDCSSATTTWTTDLNVSTAADRMLTVAYIRSDGYQIVIGSLFIGGATYMQRRRVTLALAQPSVTLTCSSLLNIEVQLLDAVNASLTYTSAWVTKLSTSSLSAQRDGVTLSSLPSPLPVANGSVALQLSGTVGATPRYVVAAVMSSDLAVSFADYTSPTQPTLLSQATLSGWLSVRQALVGGSTLRVWLLMVATFIPSTAVDWTVNWQSTTFQSSTHTVAVSGSANATLQDTFINNSLPINVDPSLSSAPFQLSLNVSTNGMRDLVVQLFTNDSSGLIVFASGSARLWSVVSAATAVNVTMQPLLPLVYGMTNLYLSAALWPVGIDSTYAQASVPPYLVTTLSATAKAVNSVDSLNVSLSSLLLDTRQSVVRLYLSGIVDAGHDINCSITAMTASSSTTFGYGSAVKSYLSTTLLSHTTFDVSLSHLLYPNQTDLAVQCFTAATGEGVAQAVAFSNLVRCGSSNNSAVTLKLSPSSAQHSTVAASGWPVEADASSASTTATVTSALAYSSGVQPLSFRPYSAVVGSASNQLVFWFPASWTLITRPPAPVNASTPLSSRLSDYVSAFSALLEAVELWVLQQRTSWNATDSVSVALYAVNMSALFNTPLCTASGSTVLTIAPSSAVGTAQGKVNCPDMLMVNNDELAARVERNELLELDDLFSIISSTSGRSLSDDLLRYAENALLIGSHFYSAGLVTDVRLLYYNKTALSAAGISAPPPASGSLTTDYSRSWTWSVLSQQVVQLGMTLHGADYEELIVAQMAAQANNAQLLSAQPTDSSYSTTAGQGSALTSPAYTQAMNITLALWLSSHKLSAVVNMSDALWNAWHAVSFVDMSTSAPLPLTGLPLLSDRVNAFIDSLYYAALAGTTNLSYASAMTADVSMAAAGLQLPGFMFDSASLSGHLGSSNEIGFAYAPSGSGYLGGWSVAVASTSAYATQCANLTALLVDSTQPYQYTIGHALHALPPYSSTWTVAPFDSNQYALQQVATTLSKPLFSPLSPLADLPSMITLNPHRQLFANVAYKNVTLVAALTASSLSVSSTYFPLVTLTNVGDTLSTTQAPTYVILAVILSALGAWVASVLVEQAIFLFSRHDVTGCMGWLLLTSVSLGGGGFWCALLMQAGSLDVSAHPSPDVTSLSVHFALDLAIVLAIPAILLPFIACLLMIDSLQRARSIRTAAATKTQSNYDQSTTAGSVMSQGGSDSRNDPAAAQKKRKAKGATLTWRELAEHLAAQMNARVATAGLCLALGLWLVRLLLPHVWLVQANFHNSAAALVVTAVVDYVLCTVCLLVLFHAMKGRLIGVFSVPAAMLFDYQLNLALMQWTYASDETSDLIHVWPVSGQAISILTGLLGAIVCLLFVGLQFKRMSLSRYALAQQVAKLRAVIESEKARAVAAEKKAAYARAEKNTLVRVMEFIHLARPISSEAAFLLAFCSQADASPLADRLLSQTAAPVVIAVKPEVEARNSGKMATRKLSAAESGSNRSQQQDKPEERDSTVVEDDQLEKAAALFSPKSPSSRALQAVAPINESSVVATSDQKASRRGTSLSDARPASVNSGVLLSPPQALRTSQTQTWMVGGSSTSTVDSAASRGYESEVSHWVGLLASAHNDKQLLVAQNRKSNIISPIRPLPSTDEEADGVTGEFSLPSPFISAALQFQRDQQQTAPLPGPISSEQVSLDAMLQHPACVEILKDELQKIHSAENLAFYLLVTRFQRIKRAELRQWLGQHVVNTYIVEGAAQQINITSRQTAAILAHHKSAHYPADMFAEAAREVKMLIATNLKQFRGSTSHRLCCWILQATALDEVRRISAAGEEEGQDGRGESRLLDELEGDGVSEGGVDSGRAQQLAEGDGVDGEAEMTRTSINSKSGTPHMVSQ